MSRTQRVTAPLDNLRTKLLTLGRDYANAINDAERIARDAGVSRQEIRAVLVSCTRTVVNDANAREDERDAQAWADAEWEQLQAAKRAERKFRRK